MAFDPVQELKTLPQYPFIDERRVALWVDRVMSIDPERIEWHVRRLSGFGGSEIGVLVGALRGYFHPHSSATELVGQKLLHVLPDEPNGHMLRGQLLEDFARDMYRKQILEQYPQAKPRDDIIANLGKFRDAERPWIIGTPDEVMELEPGKIWIIDYKCPTPDALSEYGVSGVPFYYAAQLHHYRHIAEKMGYEIAGMQLASLDYVKFRMDLRDVPYDQVLADECIYAGDYFWNEFLLRGLIPSSGAGKTYGDAADVHENIAEATALYAIYKNIGNHFSKQGDLVAKKLSECGLGLHPDVDSITVGIVDVKADRQINPVSMAAELGKHGIDPKEFTKPGDWDVDKVVSALAEAKGVSPEDPSMDAFRKAADLSPADLLAHFRRLGLSLAPHIQSEGLKLALARGKSPYVGEISGAIKEHIAEKSTEFADKVRDFAIDAEENWQAKEITKLQASTAKRRNPKP